MMDTLAFLDLRNPAFDPTGPEVRAARAAGACARTPFGVAVLRHRQMSALLGDRRLVQGSHRLLAAQGINEGPLADWMNSMILTVDGADHTRLRRLVSTAFTGRAVVALRPVMRETADELIDGFIDAGRIEFMTAFADPYPARVICALLGVPAELEHSVRGWANDLGLAFSYTIAQHQDRIETALADLYDATDQLIAARRDNPGPDLISALLTAEADGERLTATELRTMVAALLFAGQDTTRNQLGRTLQLFLAHPDQWSLLAHRPELAEAAVQEGLRVAPATTITGRVATTDLDIDGVHVPTGTTISMLLAAANTDPDVYGPRADEFDITAERSAPPLTFGAGIHYCLGALLARAEMAEALPLLAHRLGAIIPDGSATQRPAIGITGPINLPIRFTGNRP